jgi:hypothetical protein
MTEEMIGKLQAGVVRLETMFEAIERRLTGIENKMVSSDVLDQIVTRLLDRIAVDTVKPGCRALFDDFDRRLRGVERDVTGLLVKMSILAAGIAFAVTFLKNFFVG